MLEILKMLNQMKSIFINKHGSVTNASKRESIYTSYLAMKRKGQQTPVRTISKAYDWIESNKKYLDPDYK